ncbi:uncharacterized protein BDR25DRAFT_378291 [Lindgomyces ingoldianus]|uniref:Uncharacterized protein n=1 Tax=Lindgomyces ingoldianus TaxID=673940 RepID=A0ACB6QI74_9PLEO|nr:uncharacterized protein BDR25DRAFT_378291 [Lindgomyces ingoldianus]KAF2466017.1 hypothetical protein BDR25DRAFT_378291 [Lindgomyces ingoldianus]
MIMADEQIDIDSFDPPASGSPNIDTHEQKLARKVQDAISTIPDEPSQIDAIAKIRNWFSPDWEESLFYPIIQEYLIGNLDLAAIVKKTMKLIDDAISESRSEEIGQIDFGYSVLHSAKRISFKDERMHAKLVDFVDDIKTHTGNHNDYVLYDTMLSFSGSALETLNDCPGVGAGYSLPESHAYANANYFLARLTKEGVSEFWMCAIWAMRSGLEDILKDDEPNESHVPGTTIEKLNANVPAAAVWVFALGKALYDKEEDLTPTSPNGGNPAKGGDRWKGRSEFSKERWALWKQRFGDVSKNRDVSEETREIAKEAFESMDRWEKS